MMSDGLYLVENLLATRRKEMEPLKRQLESQREAFNKKLQQLQKSIKDRVLREMELEDQLFKLSETVRTYVKDVPGEIWTVLHETDKVLGKE
jgi:hypothetical protein